MSSLFKAFKNLGKTSQKAQNIKPAPSSIANKNQQTNMAQVILNNGIKMPRIGRKYECQTCSLF